MKLALTGGRGRLAPIAARHLSSLGWEVTLFSREGGDGLLPLSTLRSGEGRYDAVVHFAWSTVPFTAEARPESWEENDLPLLRDLLARDDGHLVLLSSAAVYGDTGQNPADESTVPRPLGAYARAKLLAEEAAFHNRGDRPIAALRVSNLLGEHGDPARPQGVLPRLVAAARTGEPATIWGDGSATKDYLHCADFCRALDRVLARRLCGIFNVSSGESLSLLEMIGLVERALERPVHRRHAPHYPWDVTFSRVSNAKLVAATGWSPEMSVRDAIAAAIEGGRMRKVFFTAGDGSGWAIDEDLRQLRGALAGLVQESALGSADLIHSPFWMGLDQIPPEDVASRFVIAHADNPPFFYLKQPEFARAQNQVDLWIARSREAFAQFTRLGLRAEYVPYTIDTSIFRPLCADAGERAALRRELGLPEGGYLIANFHRDTEGADLTSPKTQKCPELLLLIARKLKRDGRNFSVLLAGPRRHWLRGQLRAAGIATHFVGSEVSGDDFGINILDRQTLNRLYNAADIHVVPSRWEGGPQSVMEAAAARCKLLSVPVGLSADILEPESIFRTAPEAAERIALDMDSNVLGATIPAQFQRAAENHSSAVLPGFFREIYARLPAPARPQAPLRTSLRQASHALRRRLVAENLPDTIRVLHETGGPADLDSLIDGLRQALRTNGTEVGASNDEKIPAVIGYWTSQLAGDAATIQLVSPSAPIGSIRSGITLVAPSVQDVVNLRDAGVKNSAVVIPFYFSARTRGWALIIEEGDLRSSLAVWGALLAGDPVLYPAGSAYFEQVFHAGLPFSGEMERGDRAAILSAQRADFASLVSAPDPKRSAKALLKLLART